MDRVRFAVAILCSLAAFGPASVSNAEPLDHLSGLITRTETFLRRGESDGVTFDPRHFGDFPEMVRLSVVPQLAGYCERYRATKSPLALQDIVERANFLVTRRDACRSYDAADGLTAYALLLAYEAAGDARYQEAAAPIVTACLNLDESAASPNRALMAALALALHHRLSGDPMALAKVQAILTLVARSQHVDGSFAHACDASHDLHYTAWIAMELDRIGELIEDPNVARVLSRAVGFLRSRVSATGEVAYQEVVATGATLYYYSQPYCPADYDTRGWTNELAYHALIFDRYRDLRYHGVISRLAALESRGAFPDKWDYLPALTDPQYLWASAPQSVIRTSLAFWAMASVQSRRIRATPVNYDSPESAVLSEGSSRSIAGEGSAGRDETGLGAVTPNPARTDAWISLRLAAPSEVRLTIHDAAGRKVRSLASGRWEGGERRIRWDGRGDRGERVAAGVYFVRLEAGGLTRSVSLALIR